MRLRGGEKIKKVLILSSSSDSGSKEYNHSLSQRRGTAIQEAISDRFPEAFVQVENVGLSSHLGRNALVFLDIEHTSHSEIAGKGKDLSPQNETRTKKERSRKSLLSFGLGAGDYAFSEKGTYTHTHISLQHTYDKPKFLEHDMFLYSGFSVLHHYHSDFKNLHSLLGELGLTYKAFPNLRWQGGLLLGAVTNDKFSESSFDVGLKLTASLDLLENYAVNLSVAKSRAFTFGTLTLSYFL